MGPKYCEERVKMAPGRGPDTKVSPVCCHLSRGRWSTATAARYGHDPPAITLISPSMSAWSAFAVMIEIRIDLVRVSATGDDVDQGVDIRLVGVPVQVEIAIAVAA